MNVQNRHKDRKQISGCQKLGGKDKWGVTNGYRLSFWCGSYTVYNILYNTVHFKDI